jgi:hypothetical protein
VRVWLVESHLFAGRERALEGTRGGPDLVIQGSGAHDEDDRWWPTNEPVSWDTDVGHGGARVCRRMVSTRTRMPSPQHGQFLGVSNNALGVLSVGVVAGSSIATRG